MLQVQQSIKSYSICLPCTLKKLSRAKLHFIKTKIFGMLKDYSKVVNWNGILCILLGVWKIFL